MRDPWPSDISYFVDYLSKPNANPHYILSALGRYRFDGQPFNQQLPGSIIKFEIVQRNVPMSEMGLYALVSIKDRMGKNLVLDDEITVSKEYNDIINVAKQSNDTVKSDAGFYLKFLSNSPFSYCDFDNNFFYTFIDGKLMVYGHKKARELWIKWWNQLPQSKKEIIENTHHIDLSKR